MTDVDEVRAFNRFYTGVIGVLREGLLDTPYSLTEARVIFELARQPETSLTGLRATIGVDAGYLSRILARFEADGLIRRRRSADDGRQQVLRLTSRGKGVFRTLDARSAAQVRGLLLGLTGDDRRRLLAGMDGVRAALEPASRAAGVVLRAPASGDFGWVVERHGAIYAAEYGWDESFEAMVARVVADYLDAHDPRREAAWIAEVGGVRAGCLFCVRRDDRTAQLRLLLVEPAVRGLGLGTRLVQEATRFAVRCGYRELVLWTNDVLVDARRIYEREGFTLVQESRHHSFGHHLVGQTWARDLSQLDP